MNWFILRKSNNPNGRSVPQVVQLTIQSNVGIDSDLVLSGALDMASTLMLYFTCTHFDFGCNALECQDASRVLPVSRYLSTVAYMVSS